MISTPTVLVLGAGASMDFQYPSGGGLKGEVVNMTSNPRSDAYRTLQGFGYSTAYIQEFHEALRYSGRPSVDAFLEHRTEFMDVGKASMALALVIHEHKSNLFGGDTNWYDYLFQRMSGSFSDFDENQLAVVTFNYDRSLETYLFEALKNAYGETDQSVADVIGKIQIIHVHGQLADLRWQSANGRQYTPTYDLEKIRLSAEGISVISESSPADEAFGAAREVLKTGDRIIFLGFKFHRANFERLDMDVRSGQQRFFGTGFGFTDRERAEIEHLFKPSIITLGRRNWKVLEFLREKISL